VSSGKSSPSTDNLHIRKGVPGTTVSSIGLPWKTTWTLLWVQSELGGNLNACCRNASSSPITSHVSSPAPCPIAEERPATRSACSWCQGVCRSALPPYVRLPPHINFCTEYIQQSGVTGKAPIVCNEIQSILLWSGRCVRTAIFHIPLRIASINMRNMTTFENSCFLEIALCHFGNSPQRASAIMWATIQLWE
jgi:hypothetical protein